MESEPKAKKATPKVNWQLVFEELVKRPGGDIVAIRLKSFLEKTSTS